MGVVLAHCDLYAIISNWNGVAPDWPDWLIYIFTYLYWLLLPARVPTLFIISGYFFFRSQKERNTNFFIDKYKRRIHSLLLPYMVWNLISILLMYFRYDVLAHNGYSLSDYMSGFWSSAINGNGLPANAPLWFMRNLMVVTLTTPVIYALVKGKYGLIAIVTFASCYVMDVNIPLTGISMESILFFSTGAYIAIHRIDITSIPKPLGLATLILYIPVQVIMNSLEAETIYILCFDLFTCFVKITATFYLISLLFRKNILAPAIKTSKMSFFLYALHGIIIGPIIMVLYQISGYTDNPIALLGIYISTPLIVIAVTLMTYNILTKWAPKAAKVITGNRG